MGGADDVSDFLIDRADLRRSRFTHSPAVVLARGQRAPAEALPGPKPVFFFVPDQMRKRSRDWGSREVETRFDDAWRPFVTSAAQWLHIVEGHGRETVERVYRSVVEGDVKPHEGHILSLCPC
jgi:hypothetical protein